MQSRTIKIGLAVSLLLNIFLIGAVIGGATLLKTRYPRIMAGAFHVAGAELPANERHGFRAALRDTRRQSMPLTLAARQARQDAADLLQQPVVDQAAVSAALARARAADFALRVRLEERALAFAAALPPADRARLAQGLLRRPGRIARRPAD